MYAATSGRPGLLRLADRQAGVVTRSQLRTAGLSHRQIEQQVGRERWTACTHDVVLLQNAPPTRRQLMWIALCDAGPSGAMASHSSLELHGFRPFATEAGDLHIAIPRGAKASTIDGVVVHESRRLQRMPVAVIDGLPCIDAPVSVIDAAAWQPWPRFAVTMLASAVQQRLVSVDQLDDALRIVGRVRHKQWMRLALLDIGGGAESMSEIDVARMCREYGLQPPRRQRMRRDAAGRRRFLDCEWDTESGVTVLEIDGSHHMWAEHWDADLKRERRIVTDGRRVLRCTAFEARAEQASLAADLRRAGIPSV